MPEYTVKSQMGGIRFGGPDDFLAYLNLQMYDIGLANGYRIVVEPLPKDEPQVIRA